MSVVKLHIFCFTSFPCGSSLAQPTLTQIKSATFLLIMRLKSSVKKILPLSVLFSGLSKGGKRTSDPLRIPPSLLKIEGKRIHLSRVSISPLTQTNRTCIKKVQVLLRCFSTARLLLRPVSFCHTNSSPESHFSLRLSKPCLSPQTGCTRREPSTLLHRFSSFFLLRKKKQLREKERENKEME